MTLVLAAASQHSIWLLSDRRLSYSDGRPPKDDGNKAMALETDDGNALIAYSGLGSTTTGTEPSDWIAATFRGRTGQTIDDSFNLLANVALREMPRHILSIGTAHQFLAPALLHSGQSRIYTITIGVDGVPPLQVNEHPGSRRKSALIAATGTGREHLYARPSDWLPTLQTLLRDSDEDRVDDLEVSDYLANLNHRAHTGTRDGSVGPDCHVIWRRARSASRGGAHQRYTGTTRTTALMSEKRLPIIAGGYDVGALGWSNVAYFYGEDLEFSDDEVNARMANPDHDELNRRAAAIPHYTDEELR